MGPVSEVTPPLRPSARQKGVSYTTSTLTVAPVGWRWKYWAQAGGSAGSNRTAAVTDLGMARTTCRARYDWLIVCTVTTGPRSTATTGERNCTFDVRRWARPRESCSGPPTNRTLWALPKVVV